MNAQFYGMGFTQPRAEFHPVIRLWGQAVVNMHRIQIEGVAFAQRKQGMQQNDRIDSARQSEHQARMGWNVADKTFRHNLDDRLI